MKQKTRSKKMVLNICAEIALEIVSAICAFILPRLILSNFGSAYNGITQSISQFISCIAILKSGIGSVMRAALYKPLAEKNYSEISRIVVTTERFLRKIALIFVAVVIVFAAVYPFLVREEFSWIFASSLVIIISISTVAQYYWGLTYQMLLQADQSNYVISIVQIVTVVLNTIIAAILISSGYSIHVVKLGSAIVYVGQPVFLMLYTRKRYHINKNVAIDNRLISQRWDAFAHQLASFINTNTDIILATIFLGVKEVSVYSVYFMIVHAIKKLIMAIYNGVTGAFGNMLARKENKLLGKRFNQYEMVMFTLAAFIFSITFVMYIPFLSIYTRGVSDVNYLRPALAGVICFAEFFSCVKLPYQMVIYAVGDFKHTKVYAFIEAIINICTSLILVNQLGLIGIMIGTAVSAIFQFVVFNRYASSMILHRNPVRPLKGIIVAALTLVSTLCVSELICFSIDSYTRWLVKAVVLSVLVLFVVILMCFIFYKEEIKGVIAWVKIHKKSTRNG